MGNDETLDRLNNALNRWNDALVELERLRKKLEWANHWKGMAEDRERSLKEKIKLKNKTIYNLKARVKELEDGQK